MMLNKAILSFLIGGSMALHAAPTTIPLVNATLLNGSFENGTGQTVVTDWQTGLGSGETQRLANNAFHGSWSLVIGQSSGAPNLAASVNTNYTVSLGDSFNLAFKWLPKSQWDAADQIRWRLFTTSDDTSSGVVSEISSGTVSGFSNGAAYQTETLTGITGVMAAHEGRKLWLQFLRGNSSTNEFARVDQVELSVVTDPQASYVALNPENLIAYYPMEGSGNDFSVTGVQNDGTWNVGEAYASGVINEHCADLGAANASMSLPHTLTANFTLSFWIKTSATASSGSQWWHGHGILDGSVVGETNDIGVSLNGPKIAFGAGNPDTTILSQTSVNDGDWHHVVVQRHSSSGVMRLFINGNLESEVNGPQGLRDGSSSLALGSLVSGTGFVDACIDDLRIFNQTLDDASIAKLYTTVGDYDGDSDSDFRELIAVSAWTDDREGIKAPEVEYEQGANECKLTISAFAGRAYTLQRSSTLADGGWIDAGSAVTPKYHGPLVFTDSSAPAERGFYRILIDGRGPVREKRPNIVIIYGDDVGYGDVSSYNASSLISTPNIDQLAAEGIRFTDGHCSASTCSPSRFSMLTGVFAFREGVSIIPPTGALSISESSYTLPDMLKDAGYNTAVVGKWHLGLGNGGNNIDWNGDITPGPLEIGFDTCFMIPTTNDRVPTIYMEDRRLVNADYIEAADEATNPGTGTLTIAQLSRDGQGNVLDPVNVSNNSFNAVNVAGSTRHTLYSETVPGDRLYSSSSGHNNTFINGLGRIGFFSGGAEALWVDETQAFAFVEKARQYIAAQDNETPFFLYFASQDIHVPRAPHAAFQGSSGLSWRGDAMVQFDWSVGQILQAIEDAGLTEDTIVILSSDNGPVYDDGYADGTTVNLYSQEIDRGHDASGPTIRGGKYGILEGSTRVPFIVKWPAKIQPGGVSNALVNQVDFMASFASLLDMELPSGSARDSRNTMDALLGIDPVGVPFTVFQNNNGSTTALRVGNMKYTSSGRLYDLSTDLLELTDISGTQPGVAANMAQQLNDIINGNGVRE